MLPPTKYRLGFLVIGGGLSLSFAHHVLVAPVITNSLPAMLASYLPPVLAAAAAVSLIAIVHDSPLDDAALARAAVWYLSGAVTFGVAMYISVAQTIPGAGLRPATWFSIANWAISGSAIGLVVANYDLRRTRALAQARTNERTAAQLSQRLSVLNRVLRHDVRNRTNIIQGYAQELAERVPDSDAVTAIEEAADSLATIANRIRRVQRIVEVEVPEPVDVTNIVMELVDDLRGTYPDADIRVTVNDDVTASTYPVIRTVLAELLENAIEHNPQPISDCRVTVTVQRARQAAELVELVIEDNGPGIPEPEQVVMTGDQETQLTHSRGMSLWLTRWVIDESGGDFSIETGESTGTQIELHLPTPTG